MMPARPAFDLFRSQSRFGSLDGLRCLCILAVIWHHGPVWSVDGLRLGQRGFLGVDCFFVLSGFLITTLLLRERARRGSFSLKAFYLRRALRILPIYFLVLTIAAGGFILVKGETRYLDLLPFYVLFLGNFLTEHIPLLAPTWSLAVEEQYYIFWPLLLLVTPRRWLLAVLALLVAINVAGIMGAFAPLGLRSFVWGPLTVALPNATYAPLLIGSALAIVLDRPAGFVALWHLFGSRAAAPLMLALVVILAETLPSDLRGLPNLALHLSMAALLAALVLREDNGLAPLLQLRPFARIGEVSYGIYLYHLIGLHLAKAILSRLGLEEPWPVLVTYTLLSIVLAEISHRSFEAWFLRLKPKTV